MNGPADKRVLELLEVAKKSAHESDEKEREMFDSLVTHHGENAGVAAMAVLRNLKAMRVAGSQQTLGEALGAFLDYEFTLPLDFIRRSQVQGG